ncbi:MAG: LysM peptidoglycan-binding domain-containing protein [bacterium]|jgi:membrane-bound lytic murein transglycosylase D
MPAHQYAWMLAAGLLVALLALAAGDVMRRAEDTQPEVPPVEELLSGAAAAPEVDAEPQWDLTVTRNERVEYWIRFLRTRNHDRTRLWLERSGRYAPMIRRELRARNMPQDLVYLALIESGFSPRARSRAQAVGIWQFIAETGRRYGLEVSPYVDERRDPIAATRAALDYLQDLYRRFGSWYLAAAAYNTGENRVERILRERVGGARGHDSLFWKIDQYLPRETRDYVPLMLAAAHIAKEPEKYGFRNLRYHAPLEFETVRVPGGVSLAAAARAAEVGVDVIRDLNPHLVRDMTPPGRTWTLRIPKGRREVFARNFSRMAPSERLAMVHHTVRRGETLSHIALRYGTTVEALRAANGWIDPRRLRVGQRLRVPASRRVQASAAATRVHRVRPGDTLWALARRYGVTVSQLRAWNGLGRSDRILPGQRLRVSP